MRGVEGSGVDDGVNGGVDVLVMSSSYGDGGGGGSGAGDGSCSGLKKKVVLQGC